MSAVRNILLRIDALVGRLDLRLKLIVVTSVLGYIYLSPDSSEHATKGRQTKETPISRKTSLSSIEDRTPTPPSDLVHGVPTPKNSSHVGPKNLRLNARANNSTAGGGMAGSEAASVDSARHSTTPLPTSATRRDAVEPTRTLGRDIARSSSPTDAGFVVDAAASKQNYLACLKGQSGCNGSLLTEAQKDQVDISNRMRNYVDCLNGRYGCNLALLTPVQTSETKAASLKRNYVDCLNGRYGCDQSLLAAQQRPEVEIAALKRNYLDCINARYGCDKKLLTQEQTAAVAAAEAKRIAGRIPR